MTKKLGGECLCGAVTFVLEDNFQWFHLCHCRQCQQLTGTAFASNLFTHPDNIEWLTGAEQLEHYEHESREFSKTFCRRCGSALPFVNKSKTSLIVPAGSLNQMPDIQPQANIFALEKASWVEPGRHAEEHTSFVDWRNLPEQETDA